MPPITLITSEPTIVPIAHMQLIDEGVLQMAEWVKSHRPDCVPAEGFKEVFDLLPHGKEEDGRLLTDNEILAEISGRKCYDSFAEKAGKKTNREYMRNVQRGAIPHASIMYHAKMSFFIAGVSRRVSHELIRHYVGADRDEEGSPSQESTRFTHHYGWYIVHPRDLEDRVEVELFKQDMQANYDSYTGYIDRQMGQHKEETGKEPRGMKRKRIFEAASQRLDHACETSFIWTTNPMALVKLFKERCNEAADLEIQRLANKWKRICLELWPNLFVRIEIEEEMQNERSK